MRFVKIEFTGKTEDGRVFDTTDVSIAKKNNIFNDKRIYAPLPVIIGEGNIIKGLENAISDMNVGTSKTVNIDPKDGYGERMPNLVRVVPINIFKKQNITPLPGAYVNLDGVPAKIQTVSGGRVRVDLNHELAGKKLVYDVKVVSEAKNDDEKIMYLIEKNFGSAKDFKVTFKKGEVSVDVPRSMYIDKNFLIKKATLAAEIFKYLNVEKIKFEEMWEKKK